MRGNATVDIPSKIPPMEAQWDRYDFGSFDSRLLMMIYKLRQDVFIVEREGPYHVIALTMGVAGIVMAERSHRPSHSVALAVTVGAKIWN